MPLKISNISRLLSQIGRGAECELYKDNKPVLGNRTMCKTFLICLVRLIRGLSKVYVKLLKLRHRPVNDNASEVT